MSIERRVVGTAAAVLGCLALGAWLIVYFGVRDYLANDAALQAENAALSLSQSLSPALASADQGLVATIVDSVYQEDNFKSVRVTSPVLTAPIVRTGAQGVSGVPTWFTRIIPLPVASAQISLRGDNRARHVITVVLDPGEAYRRLWSWGLQLLVLFAVSAALLWALIWFYFRRFVAPITAVTDRLGAIGRHQFEAQGVAAHYRELAALADAANTVNDNTRERFDTLENRIEALDNRLMLDPVTQLNNRNSLSSEHGSDFSDVTLEHAGAIIIVEIDGLAASNRVHGAHATDNVLFDIGEVLRHQCAQTASANLWRLSGSRFMCRSALIDEDHVKVWCDAIDAALHRLAEKTPLLEPASIHVAGSVHRPGRTLADALTFTDDVLAVAREEGGWRVFSSLKTDPQDIRFAKDKAKQLRMQLTGDALQTLYRPALWLDSHKPYHTQLVLSVNDVDGQLMSDSVLAGLIAKTGLQRTFIATGLDIAGGAARAHPELAFALDVGAIPAARDLPGRNSHDSDSDEDAIASWLDLFRDRLAVVPSFAVQIQERRFSARVLEALLLLRQTLQGSDMRLGITGFGESGHGFGYLDTLRPDYVVTGPAVGRSLHQEAGARFHLRALADIVAQLDIDLIVAGIDDRHRWQHAREAGATAGMGDYAGRMRPTVPTVLDVPATQAT